MRKFLLAAVVFVLASFGGIGAAFAQYGPPPSTAPVGVAGGAVGTGAGTGVASTGTGTGTSSGLAFTGSGILELLLRVGIVLVAIGGLVLLYSRRRRFRTVGS